MSHAVKIYKAFLSFLVTEVENVQPDNGLCFCNHFNFFYPELLRRKVSTRSLIVIFFNIHCFLMLIFGEFNTGSIKSPKTAIIF